MSMIEKAERFTRATGDNVTFKPREDLFSETDKESGFSVVSLATDITAVPDNIALVEVTSAGELVTHLKPGDLAFLDFYHVKQGYIVGNDELYIAGQDCIVGLYDEATQEIRPLDNHVVTRRIARERFEVALTGTDRMAVPRMITSVAGGRTSGGNVSTEVLYEEVVAVGKLTNRPRPGVMTRAERALIDALVDYPAALSHGDARVEGLLGVLLFERANGRSSDIAPGEMVVFCKDIAQSVRCKGEFWHLVPYDNVLAAIDDEGLLNESVRQGKSGKLQLVG